MLFQQRFKPGIRDGTITLTFRRWSRPQAVAGGRYRVPPIGFIEVTSIERTTLRAITDADARRSGFDTADALRTALERAPSAPGAPLYRVDFRYLAGAPDARADLARSVPDAGGLDELNERLDATDRRSPRGPWTWRILNLISEHPERRAGDLATMLGWDTPTFKSHVRRLKTLGLTDSLEVGYRLSPRGRRLHDTRQRPTPAGGRR